MNTGLFTGRVSKGFMAWREFAERTPDLPIGMIMQGATTTELPPEVIAAYEAPFPNAESKAGAQRFPLLVPLSAEDTGAREMAAVQQALAQLGQARAGGVLGQRSRCSPTRSPARSSPQLIPTAGEQVRIEGAAHFLQEDRGPQIVQAMLDAFGRPGGARPDGRPPPPGLLARRLVPSAVIAASRITLPARLAAAGLRRQRPARRSVELFFAFDDPAARSPWST